MNTNASPFFRIKNDHMMSFCEPLNRYCNDTCITVGDTINPPLSLISEILFGCSTLPIGKALIQTATLISEVKRKIFFIKRYEMMDYDEETQDYRVQRKPLPTKALCCLGFNIISNLSVAAVPIILGIMTQTSSRVINADSCSQLGNMCQVDCAKAVNYTLNHI